jgi:hypothetical protein
MLEKRSVDEIEYKFKLFEGKIKDHLKQLQALKSKVPSANDKLASPHLNQAELFVHVKRAKNVESDANKCIEDISMNVTVSDIEFQPDRNLLQCLKQNKTIGLLTEKTMKTDDLLQITGGQSYCVKVMSDENECSITSACYMEKGTIILADYNNNKLKRLDSHNYTITGCYNLPGQP